MCLKIHRRRSLGLAVALLLLMTACRVDVGPVEVAVRAGAASAPTATVPVDMSAPVESAPESTTADSPDENRVPAAPQEVARPDKGSKGEQPGSDEFPDGSGPGTRPLELPDQPLSRESPAEPTPTPTPSPAPPPQPADNPFADPISGGGIDFRLTRNDVDCDEDNLAAYDDTVFVVAHVVVDGNLGAPCFGSSDPRLIEAWQVLAAITPSGQLHDLGLFGGYVSAEEGETTLAFVNPLDYEGALYQMSINLDEAEADPDELRLTMAHEFSHVFTALSTQIDRYALPNDCETWDNGEGCYLADSLMWGWITHFWGGGFIDQIDPYDEPTTNGGESRCSLDSGFLGPYSASSPEEDFAESFSAFVFRLDVDTPGLQAKMDWFAQQPGLVEFQVLAIQAGYEPQRNYFERCG